VWATANGIHPWIVEYLVQRPDHLWSAPPKTEEPFSTPRAWHMLSDVMHSYGDALDDDTLAMLAFGTLTNAHASAFRAYVKTVRHAYDLAVLKGDAPWPRRPEDRDLLVKDQVTGPWDAVLAWSSRPTRCSARSPRA
jgi:hypothetical protein